MVSKEYTVDLSKPLVFQVGNLGQSYQEWVHQPIVSQESPRFFETGFLEFLTRTVWWAIPVVWLPVVFWSAAESFRMGRSLPELLLLLSVGVFIWTFIEYSMHRFLFHVKTKTYWANTAHYILHGFHHKHPMDGLRLVFPPAATAIICIPFWGLAKLVAPAPAAPALFGGGLLGYVLYDCTHYYLHHGQPSLQPAKHLKRYHMSHHFRIQMVGFGITSSIWDGIFGTLPPAQKA